MIQSKLQQTEFQIEPLKHIVGIGNSAPYQIFTSPGKQLGKLGPVIETDALKASNENAFEAEETPAQQKTRTRTLFSRFF